MNVEISDSDSNSSEEVLILKQIKPILINSSQLVQSTLEGISIKSSSNSLCNKNKEQNIRRRKKKRSSDSNEGKSKKIKRSVSGGGSSQKVLVKSKSSVKNMTNIQSTISSEEIILDEVKKSTVKNVQKTIHSYFAKKKLDVNSEESEKTKLSSSLNVTSKGKIHKNLHLKTHESFKGKNIQVSDNNKSVITEGVMKNSFTTHDELKSDPLSKECEAEKSFKTSDITVEKHTHHDETLPVEADINFEELFSFEEFQSNFNEGNTHPVKSKYLDHSKLLCFYFKKIIKDEMEKQIALESACLKNGKIVEKLILDYESKILEKFLNLNENASKIFIRMLGRKKSWHRVCMINYPDISNDLNTEFEILHKEGFIDVNIEDESLKTQMGLLNKSEVLELCKTFNICVKSSSCNSYRKETLISSFLKNCKKQKSALDMFKVKTATTRLDILKSKIKTYLGSCVRVNDKIFQIFYKILLLFSFAHYYDEESKRFSNELFTWLQVLKNVVRFPDYKLSPTVIFETLADFEEYKNSLVLQESFEVAISNKNYDVFVSAYNEAKVQFKKLLENEECCKRVLNLKPFLRKFSAGTIYAKILTKYCKTFKKQSSNSEIEDTAQLLLAQNLFLIRKKGEWYEILSKVLENKKHNNAAAELIIKSLKDPVIDEVQKLSLQLRGHSILKKKTCGISEAQLRDLLDSLCVLSVQEPSSIEITGKALEGSSGFKSVYVQELAHGKVYASVEERAILYYKSKGFTQGYHSEGFIVQTIYFLLFFDIIYGSSPEGVFQSPYQKAPLDLSSRSFFHNRKEEIEALMNDMLNWDDKQVEAKIRDSYYKNYNTACVISWNEKFTPELFCEIIKCITMPILVLIFDRLVKNFRVFRSGFPDLTLWNPETNQCKFVEVKSPNDKLSPAQRIWLDFLKNIGLNCEVCNVKNFSSKSLQ